MITETRFTWADAKDECRNLGGVLGVPSSDPEHEFIAQLIPTGGTVWLDCTDIDVGGTGSAERVTYNRGRLQKLVFWGIK